MFLLFSYKNINSIDSCFKETISLYMIYEQTVNYHKIETTAIGSDINFRFRKSVFNNLKTSVFVGRLTRGK